MSFDSPIFLFLFLPVLLILEALIKPVRAKNVLLCLAGLIFYAFGELWALALLLVSALVNWLLGLAAMRRARWAVPLAAVLNLGLLAAAKYLGFFGEGLSLLGLNVNLPAVIAPAGVSFFTFKGISYVVDAHRSPESGTRSFFAALFYISFLPEVISGPLTRFSDFSERLYERSRGWLDTAEGLRRFALGLAKKLILSGAAASAADAAFSAGAALDARVAWLGAVAYTLQLYFDFSGYSDMACGLGRALGFKCAENFDHPYAAVSITDFWRRWHISLSSWFRDYLYIPLGGSRRGKWRAAANKAIVFVLCGLWHGANMTFVLWGAWHGLLSALESLKILDVKRWRKNPAGRALSRVYTLLAVCIGFTMFRAASVAEGFDMIAAMFAGWDFSLAGSALLADALGGWTLFALIFGCAAAAPILPRLKARLGGRPAAELAGYAASLALLVLSFAALASGGFAPFIYAQF